MNNHINPDVLEKIFPIYTYVKPQPQILTPPYPHGFNNFEPALHYSRMLSYKHDLFIRRKFYFLLYVPTTVGKTLIPYFSLTPTPETKIEQIWISIFWGCVHFCRKRFYNINITFLIILSIILLLNTSVRQISIHAQI